MAENGVSWWKRSAFPVLLAAVLGMLGGGPGYRLIDNPRENPWTNKQANEQRREHRAELAEALLIIKERDQELALRIKEMGIKHELRMDGHERRMDLQALDIKAKPPPELLERVTRLEERQKAVPRAPWCFKGFNCPNDIKPGLVAPGRVK